MAYHAFFVILYTIMYTGGGFRTHDLQIMSIALYEETGTLGQAELPRHKLRLTS